MQTKKFILITIAAAIVLSAIAIGGVIVWQRSHEQVPGSSAASQEPVNHVANDPIGLKFDMVKTLAPLDAPSLKQLSPYFIYGYKQADVNNVLCAISQTKRTKGDTVTPDVLGNGTYNQIKKTFPDAQLLDYQAITLKNGHEAAYIFVSYTDNKVVVKHEEIIAATNDFTTFGFCTSPDSLFEYYRPKFNIFLLSFEVY